jgi:hypothetical protein
VRQRYGHDSSRTGRASLAERREKQSVPRGAAGESERAAPADTNTTSEHTTHNTHKHHTLHDTRRGGESSRKGTLVGGVVQRAPGRVQNGIYWFIFLSSSRPGPPVFVWIL